MLNIPLTLYIHIPWCVKKCPYCDFNSHQAKGELPETEYLAALLADLQQDLSSIQEREITAIFIGGGTPSLFSPAGMSQLLTSIAGMVKFAEDIEITLEANPGTVEYEKFAGFKAAGINRLSIGIQSFQAEKLKALGRIHNGQEAIQAVLAAQNAGFSNFNLDLMYGLPQQNIDDAVQDLQTALSLKPTHLSWYQLTLEPNTAFFHAPPMLPTDDRIWEIQTQGQAFLASHGFHPYEVSAYTTHAEVDRRCRHNLNYWTFGDYLGIGAGAHGKVTDLKTNTITRTWKTRHPKDYLNPKTPYLAGLRALDKAEIAFEFMLNALRLYDSTPVNLFASRTGLKLQDIETVLQNAQKKDLLNYDAQTIETTPLGKRYLNDLLTLFL